MYDLFWVGLLFCIEHIAVAYAAIEIWQLDYRTYLLVTSGVSVVLALIFKAMSVAWKDRIAQAVRGEWDDRELLPDVLLFLLTMSVGAAVTGYLVYRRYGVGGWLGATAVNYAVGWIV